jgi:hypothetical protein
MSTTSRLLAAMAVLGMPCSDQTPSDPEGVLGPGTDPGPASHALPGVKVLTPNLYVGTDVDAVIGALRTPDPGDDLPTLLAAIDILRRTDFSSRVSAIAGEIIHARPHDVGLQEVSQVDLVLPTLRADRVSNAVTSSRASPGGDMARHAVGASSADREHASSGSDRDHGPSYPHLRSARPRRTGR